MRSLLAALSLVFIICVPANAEARSRHKQKSVRTDNVSVVLLRKLVAQNEKLARQNEKFEQALAAITAKINPDAVASSEPVQLGIRNPVLAPITIPSPDKTLAGYGKHIERSAKLKDLTPGLANKVAEILGACNTRITSGYRRGARVAGSGRPSLHSLYPSQAADLVGDPKCIYRHLAKWPGGYSVDYAAVGHAHVSLSSSGRERGARFVHYRGGSRYASRRQHAGPRRYAIRQEQPVAWERHAVAR